MKIICTVEQFVQSCISLNNQEIYDLFEGLPDAIRNEIYTFSTDVTNEPTRSAFNKLGELHGVPSLYDY